MGLSAAARRCAGFCILICSTAFSRSAVTAQSTNSYSYDALGRVSVSSKTSAGSVVNLTCYNYDSADDRTNLNSASVSSSAASASYNTATQINLAVSGPVNNVTIASNPAHGAVSLAGAVATYTPASGYYGSDSFTFTAASPCGTEGPATVAVTVNVSAPTATPASLSVGYNTVGSVSLTGTGPISSYAIASNPSHGAVSLSGSTATYTPTSSYYGSDSFTFTASGPGGTSAPAAVSVTVASPSAPVAKAGSLSVAYNTAGSVALSGTGMISSYAIASNPGHGAVSLSGSTATYAPTSGYYGSDSFTFTASGPGGTSAPAAISVSVGVPPAPTASNGSLTVKYNTPGSLALSGSGVISSYAIASNPSHGSASISGSTATYTPTSGYSGPDSFTFNANGPGGSSQPATVSVSVLPAAPVANSVSLSVNQNSSGNGVPLNISGGTPTSVAVASNPSHGSASASGTSITYTPASGYAGSDSFTYTASNAGGTSAAATVSINVMALTATIGSGQNVTNSTASYGFLANTATVSGGSGNYSYLWSETDDGIGKWSSGGTSSSYSPSVLMPAANCENSIATYSVTVTDNFTGKSTTSNGARYLYTHKTSQPCS